MNVDYEVWWPLHIRSAQGKELTAEESETLSTAYRQADEEELAQFSHAALQQARESRTYIEALDEEEKRLLARREELDREIAHLESLRDGETRRGLELKEAVIGPKQVAIIIPRKTQDAYIRSPHFANPADALRFQKREVVEPEASTDASV